MEDAGNRLCMTVAQRDLNFLKRLLDNGINPNAKNYDSRTPLHLAASEGLYSMTTLLLKAGASVLAKDRYNLTIDSCISFLEFLFHFLMRLMCIVG